MMPQEAQLGQTFLWVEVSVKSLNCLIWHSIEKGIYMESLSCTFEGRSREHTNNQPGGSIASSSVLHSTSGSSYGYWWYSCYNMTKIY